MAVFDIALALVLKSEGGKVDDPRDPGGRTNEGITQAVYDAWKTRKGQATRTVYLIQPEEVSAIYKTQYADPLHFDDLPPGLAYAAFDAGVMSGPVRGAQWLQGAIGADVDGHVGILTVAAANKADPVTAINKLCDLRMQFLRSLPTWGAFGAGWTNRVNAVRRDALSMRGATLPPPAKPVAQPSNLTPSPKPELTRWQHFKAALGLA